jgi:hypothetical protein
MNLAYTNIVPSLDESYGIFRPLKNHNMINQEYVTNHALCFKTTNKYGSYSKDCMLHRNNPLSITVRLIRYPHVSAL